MMRWDVINYLIEKNNYKSYLEIGYFQGWSFDNVKGVELKVAVDPNPLKEEWMKRDDWGSFMDVIDGCRIQISKETSDKFFERLPIDRKVDIIFIDGLHEAEQVTKDIENSLKHLSSRGTIVLHDCNPPKYEHTTTGIDGCWTGDVYKSAIGLQELYPYQFYTIDTDWGVGVLTPDKYAEPGRNLLIRNFLENGILENWEYFEKYRTKALNLISVEEFLK